MKLLSYDEYTLIKGHTALSFTDYTTIAKSRGRKAMDEDDYDLAKNADEEEDEEDGEDDEDEEAEKSDIGVSDLLKSITDYENVDAALNQAGGSRQTFLQARLDSGMISKSERQELGRLWAGDEALPAAGGTIRKSLSQTIEDDSVEVGQLIDGSDFLKSLVTGVDDSLDAVTNEVLRDGAATRQLLKAQGGIIVQQSHVIGSMFNRLQKSEQVIDALATRLGIVEGQPAPKRSVGNHDPRSIRDRKLAKSSAGGGGPSTNGGLTPEQIRVGMNTLVKSAADKDDGAALDALSKASARWEGGFGLPNNIVDAIRNVHGLAA